MRLIIIIMLFSEGSSINTILFKLKLCVGFWLWLYLAPALAKYE